MRSNLNGVLYAVTSPDGIDFILLDKPLTEEDLKKFHEICESIFLTRGTCDEILKECKRGYIPSLFSHELKGKWVSDYLEKYLGKEVEISIKLEGSEEEVKED